MRRYRDAEPALRDPAHATGGVVVFDGLPARGGELVWREAGTTRRMAFGVADPEGVPSAGASP